MSVGHRMALFVSRASCGLVLASVLAIAPVASADPIDHEKAAAAFRSARADITAGRCAAAIPKLQESLSYEPSVGAHLSIADCYEQVDLLAAWRELQEAADLAAARSDPRASVALARAAAFEHQLSVVHLVFTPAASDLSGVDVLVDGTALAPSLVKRGLFVTTPGAHVLAATAAHTKPWHGQLQAGSAGSNVSVTIALEDETSAPASGAAVGTGATPTASTTATAPVPPPPPDAGTSPTQRTVALWTGGVGLVGLAAGGIFGILALGKNSDLRDACGGDVHACTAAPGAASVTGPQGSARTVATLSTVAFIVGGVGLATGIVLFATAPSHGVQVGAGVMPGGAGFSLGGSL